MVIIAIPFFSMRLGSADAGSDPASSTTRKAYDLLAKGFGPGYNGPLQLVAEVDSPAQQAAFARVVKAVAEHAGSRRVTGAADHRRHRRAHRRGDRERLSEGLAAGRLDLATCCTRSATTSSRRPRREPV